MRAPSLSRGPPRPGAHPHLRHTEGRPPSRGVPSCLPADINDVSCVDGEVEASVFDRYRDPLYKEASFKPYIIAAMIFLAKVKDPQATLKALEERGLARWFQK